MMREGFARPFGWRGMMADLEEGGLVSRVAGMLGAGWRGEEGALFETEEVILEFQSSVVSILLLGMR